MLIPGSSHSAPRRGGAWRRRRDITTEAPPARLVSGNVHLFNDGKVPDAKGSSTLPANRQTTSHCHDGADGQKPIQARPMSTPNKATTAGIRESSTSDDQLQAGDPRSMCSPSLLRTA